MSKKSETQTLFIDPTPRARFIGKKRRAKIKFREWMREQGDLIFKGRQRNKASPVGLAN